MKMTLDQLRVDSYATQVSENELVQLKGGTITASSTPCYSAALATATAISNWWNDDDDSETSITVGTTTLDTDASVKADSITTKGIYGLEINK